MSRPKDSITEPKEILKTAAPPIRKQSENIILHLLPNLSPKRSAIIAPRVPVKIA